MKKTFLYDGRKYVTDENYRKRIPSEILLEDLIRKIWFDLETYEITDKDLTNEEINLLKEISQKCLDAEIDPYFCYINSIFHKELNKINFSKTKEKKIIDIIREVRDK